MATQTQKDTGFKDSPPKGGKGGGKGTIYNQQGAPTPVKPK